MDQSGLKQVEGEHGHLLGLLVLPGQIAVLEDLPFRTGVDLQCELDEQVHQRIGDLRLPDMAQRGQ
ncbi:hypothetical protein [Streptomyces afghaniensis]|uniref:hypothetical protein n=1 Tax=Streptomyces afghaniensis TaxID=66865 RepID=UPI002781C993|nr:hypothetical protein [Streptomyces afghaniensis]MDQ1021704.1 hypothetical protein [Streptomyces afghaniensis]